MMTPGAHVRLALRRKVMYHISIGKPLQGSNEVVNHSSLYYFAAPTNIITTLPMIMKVEGE